ncbi:hypothetical protein [Teredinibacter turnerae]|uniref:hypothetical protein n=1 Tax=Teredinibacter turnerae TaxID=2426 RepID=UPI0030CD8E8A
MSKDKPDLYTIEPALINKYTDDELQVFTREIESGASPSRALHAFIAHVGANSLDSSIIFSLLRMSYPEIDLSSITGLIHDSGYPFGNPDDLDDDGFDELVRQAYENPSEW